VAALALLLAVNMVSLREYWLHFQKEEWDHAASYVAGRVEADDLLLFHASWVQIPFDYYYRAYGKSAEERGVPVDLFATEVLEPKMTDGDLPRLRALVRGHRRVWLIYSHDWYTDPQGQVPAALEETLDLAQRRAFYGLEVRLYSSPQITEPYRG